MWSGTLLTGCPHASEPGLLIDGRVLSLPRCSLSLGLHPLPVHPDLPHSPADADSA